MCVFSVNDEGLTLLDVAVMTNNIPMAKMLLLHGAKESPLCEFVFLVFYSCWEFL